MTVPNEIEDAKCVYQYVSTLPFIDTKRIAILGASQGGVVASMTAGELGHGKLKAAVLLCPAAVLRDDCIKGNTMGKRYNPLAPPETLDLGNGKILGREFIKTAFSLPIYETAERYHGKACIIHGTGDRTALTPTVCVITIYGQAANIISWMVTIMDSNQIHKKQSI